ncbi:recombinase zinc beta ribbon domain-containing protein [Aureimonas mangrovi]|uniref:recombinase zinc beta ribbon domain-containing protein n=1 Tax=Aureimonas mangrovi TaxID=2758041 RepID=UPI00163D4243
MQQEIGPIGVRGRIGGFNRRVGSAAFLPRGQRNRLHRPPQSVRDGSQFARTGGVAGLTIESSTLAARRTPRRRNLPSPKARIIVEGWRRHYSTVCAFLARIQAIGARGLRTGTSRNGAVHRYYACSACARSDNASCKGRSVRADSLDDFVVEHLPEQLFTTDPAEVHRCFSPRP